jgi:hypothetical protein
MQLTLLTAYTLAARLPDTSIRAISPTARQDRAEQGRTGQEINKIIE